MKKTCLIFTAFFISAFGISQDLKRIDSLLSFYYHDDAPGAAIGIQYQGKIIYTKGFGLANIATAQPIGAGTIFNIGSLTKQFTALGILQLVAEKKINAQESLHSLLPSLPAAISIKITLQQLLSHSSGLPDHYGFTDTNQVRHATDQDVEYAMAKASALLFAPGTKYRYSNTAYCLLGRIIEKRSGVSYSGFIRNLIFDPLGMKSSSIINLRQPVTNAALGYTATGAGRFAKLDAAESIFFSTEADGGVYTSIDDYLRWCRALEDGGFHPSLVQQAWTPQTLIDSNQQLHYGDGWFLAGSGDRKIVYHTGSNGGFRSVCFMIPARQYAVVMFSNRDDIDLESIVMRINEIFHMDGNSFIKSSPLESFIPCWPIFAPCKEIPSSSISFIRNWNASGTASN